MDIFDHPLMLMALGSLAAIFAVGFFYFASRFFFEKDEWPYGMLVVLGVEGAILTFCALGYRPYLVEIAIFFLFLLGVLGIRKERGLTFSHLRNACRCDSKWSKVAFFFLLIQLFWAAAPFCRYDQWNYHLPISKQILSFGRLPHRIFDDHIYFTGVYEYLFLMPRLLVNNDFFLASFSNAFTWFLALVLLLGAVRVLALRWDLQFPEWTILAFFLMATFPYQHSLTNAKPEAILAVASVLCVAAWPFPHASPRWHFIFAFTVLWPVALKVTWLHAAAAFLCSYGIFIVRHWRWKSIFYAFCGGFLALGLSGPTLVKNFVYFGNPLHPAQLGPFQSQYWNTSMVRHWQESTGAAKSLATYIDILFRHIPLLLVNDLWPQVLVVIATLVMAITWKRIAYAEAYSGFSLKIPPKVLPPIIALIIIFLIYLLLTPWMVDPLVQARFTLPGAGIMIGAAVFGIGSIPSSGKKLKIILFLIALFAGSWDVQARKLLSLLNHKSVTQFYASYGFPYHHQTISQIVNSHRKTHFPRAKPLENIVATSNPTKYFFDSFHVRLGFYDFEMLAREFQRNRKGSFCLADLFSDLGISYIFIEQEQRKALDPQILKLESKFGAKISDAFDISFFSKESLRLAARDSEVCPLGATPSDHS